MIIARPEFLQSLIIIVFIRSLVGCRGDGCVCRKPADLCVGRVHDLKVRTRLRLGRASDVRCLTSGAVTTGLRDIYSFGFLFSLK